MFSLAADTDLDWTDPLTDTAKLKSRQLWTTVCIDRLLIRHSCKLQ